MAREIDLLGYWMPVLRQLKEFKEIAKAETPELKYILEQIERTLNNMFIETADEYGIKRFEDMICLLYASPSPRDYAASRMPSSA